MTPQVKPETPEPAADPATGRITHSREGRVLRIGIDRAAKRNGFTPEMFRGLAEAYTELEDDGDLRAGVVFAHGQHFTAGLDLERMKDSLGDERAFAPEGLVDPFDLLDRRRSKPVVAAVEGITFTIGIELMLAADIVVADPGCRFAQLEVRRGIMANAGATLRFVERAGWGNAMALLLTGREFGTEEAHRLGFVQEVAAPGGAFGRAHEIADGIAEEAAPLGVRAMRESARTAVREGWDAAIAEFPRLQSALLATEDAAEGVRSFVERRAARFQGK